MPQTFQVLKCYKCSIFQVHLAKKSNKWECKVCGEKQSIKQHYGIGTALECRGHVQKLNEMQGDKSEAVTIFKTLDSDDDDFEYIKKEVKLTKLKKKSKWSAFIDENDENSDEDYRKDSDYENPVSKKKKQEHKEVTEEEYYSKPNIHSKSKEKKLLTQESKINSKKWSAFVSGDDLPNNSRNKHVQVHKTQIYQNDLYISNRDECAKSTSISHNILSTEKAYPVTDYNLNSNKWSAYVSDSENELFPMTREQVPIHMDGKKEMIQKQNRQRSQDESLKNSKESTVTADVEPQLIKFDTNTTIYDDETRNVKVKQGLFSLCDDNDLDSILDF